jgi:hypothetical protein
MKLLLLIIVTAVATQCQNSSHRTVRHTHKSTSTTKSSGVITGNETGILVSAQWMKRYKHLESKFGSIAEDEKIYMEGEQYRIPQEVADHFNDMVILEGGR